jgi:pimeloyl-ACP methyl ester carboxylesterase
MVHGVAMNFYMTPLARIGQVLAEQAYHCFVINTRGHDWISRAGDLTAFGGAAYENLEDCLKDLDGALDYLSTRGYMRFILVGHSLGCVKSLLYQGTRQRLDVVGMVSCSCPKQYYSARAIEQPQFKELMANAEQLLAQGKGEEFLWAPASGGTGLFSARTFVSKYGPHEKNDVRLHAGRLGCPFLAIAGGTEHPFFPEYAKELADAADRAWLRIKSSRERITRTASTNRSWSKFSLSGSDSSKIDRRRLLDFQVSGSKFAG